MSKEYNLAGKHLVVDGVTILGRKRSQKSSILSQAITNGQMARDNALTGEQVQALGGTVILISEDLDETKGRVTTNENNIEGLDGRMDTAEGNISSQGGRITTAEGNISDLQQVTRRFDVRSKQTSIVRDDTEQGFQIIVLQSTIVGYDNPSPRLAIDAAVENFYRVCAYDNNPSAATLDSLIEGSSVNPVPTGEGSWYRGGLLFEVGEKAAYILNNEGDYITAIITITAVSETSITGTIDTGGIINAAIGVDDRDMTSVSLYIPLRRAGKVDAYLYNSSTLMDQLHIPVSNITRRWKEIPAVDRVEDLPNTEGEGEEVRHLVDGDCCVVRYTGSPEKFTATTYVYKNGTWEPASEEAQYSDAAQIIQTVYSVVEEAQEYKNIDPSFSYEDIYVGTKGLFQKLVVGIVYAARIFTEEITSINWDGVDSDKYPKAGFRLSTKDDMIQAVAAVLKGARIRESDLYDVSVSSLDADKTILFKTNKSVSPPATNPLTFNNESNGVYTESDSRSYSWQAGVNDNVPLSRFSGYSGFTGAKNLNQTIQFTVQNSCYLYIRAPYWNKWVISGTPGKVTLTVYVNGIEQRSRTEDAFNTTNGLFMYFSRGDLVRIEISYAPGTDRGIEGIKYAAYVQLLRYYDVVQHQYIGDAETSADRLEYDALGKSSQITWSVPGGSSGTSDFFFPVAEYKDNYVATDLFDASILVDGAPATSKASLVETQYDAVAQFWDAKGSQGGVPVDAIPRESVVNFQQVTVYYKRDPYAVNQLILSQNQISFYLNEQLQFTVYRNERSTINYSITLPTIEPSLTVTDLMPVDATTNLGKQGSEFDEGHIKTIKTQSIQRQFGHTLDIQADTISGDLTGDVTGDVTGNVNAPGTTKKVYGAVFN